MIEHNNSQQGIRILFIAAAVVIIIVGIHQAQQVLAMLLASVFLAVIGTPQVHWLERKRIPSAAAVLIVIAGMLVILLMCGVLVGTSIKSLSDALPFYYARLQQHALALTKLLAGFGVAVHSKDLLAHVNPEVVNKWIVGSFAGASSVVSASVVVLLTVSFILFEASSFPIKLRAALGDPRAHFPRFIKLVDDVKRYVVIQTAISLTAGVLIGTWLAIFGVDFAVLFGLLTFLLNFIPNVGSVIALIPIAFLTLIQFGAGRAALVSAGYVVVVFLLGNVVQPRLMGQKLGLSTLVVFLSLLFWGSLLGLIGMVLCVPFTMALKFSLECNEDTRWIATLLGRAPTVKKSPTVSKK
jgi:predicted PurR-regulated permease PerM